MNDFKKIFFFEVHHGVILLNDSDGVVAATVVVLDIPVIAFITPLILFLAAIIIEVKLNTIINTKITITKIQIYLTNYSYDIYDGFYIYISFIKKKYFFNQLSPIIFSLMNKLIRILLCNFTILLYSIFSNSIIRWIL